MANAFPSAKTPMASLRNWRAAPEVEARITKAIADGRLTVMAAKAVEVSPNATGARVRYRRRGQAQIEGLEVGAIVDCTGIVKNPDATGNPVIRSMFEQGLARIDPLRMGVEVAPDCAIVDRRGLPSRRLFAVGPLTRAAFWEIIAIPDIRNQCVQLAQRLVRNAEERQKPQRDAPLRTVSIPIPEVRAARPRAAHVGHH